MKLQTLTNRLGDMNDKNQQGKVAAIKLSSLRQQRDAVLYKAVTGRVRDLGGGEGLCDVGSRVQGEGWRSG